MSTQKHLIYDNVVVIFGAKAQHETSANITHSYANTVSYTRAPIVMVSSSFRPIVVQQALSHLIQHHYSNDY